MNPATVKEQQSQGCFAGCGGRKKKKVPRDKMPTERPKGPPQGVELIWQPQTVQQYYSLLRKSENKETLEGSAGALHNLTACSWKVGLKNFVTVFLIHDIEFAVITVLKKRICVSCPVKSSGRYRLRQIFCWVIDDGSYSQRTRSII